MASGSGSALVSACGRGDYETVKRLLELGTDVNEKNEHQECALYRAARYGRLKVAQLLLQYGADVNATNRSNQDTALMAACEGNHIKVAWLLIDHGANINMQESNDGWSALMISSHYGHTETAKLLLDNGTNVNMQQIDGWSALMSSSQEGHTETAKLLLDRGANVNIQNNNGWSALMSSSQNGHTETAKLLLDRGANVNMQNSDGWSALMSSSRNGHTETAKLLLDSGANINTLNNGGWSALMSSSQEGHTETAKLLLDRGANVNMQNSDGWSALMSSSYHGHTETAKLLLDRGANVNMQNGEGWSALMHSSQKGHTDTAKLLLDRGANVNIRNASGMSALMISCRKGRVETVKLLLQRGADRNMQDNSKWTALTYAQRAGHTETVQVLQRFIPSQQRQAPFLDVTKFASKVAYPPSPQFLGPSPGWGTGPGSVDSGIGPSPASTWDMGPSPAPSWGIGPSPGPAPSPVYSVGVPSPSASRFALPLSPAKRSPLPPRSPFHSKHSAYLQSSLTGAASDSGHNTTENLHAQHSVLVTNGEQLFSWEEYGLNLYIPENSLPDNLAQCSIHFRATVTGDYQLPQDTHLVSAMYQIDCVPKCQFSKPLVLEVQHCGAQDNQSELCFLKDSSSDHDGAFQIIPGGEFPPKSSYGSIEVNNFCRVGVGKRGSNKRHYCASVYYSEEDATDYRIHYVILWDTKAHKKLVGDYYQAMNAIDDTKDLRVEFRANSISLDVPPSGVTTEDDSWTIAPMGHPEIMKEDVDRFGKNKRIPSCQLKAECLKQESTLKHLVWLSGAKKPFNYFRIHKSSRIAANKITVGSKRQQVIKEGESSSKDGVKSKRPCVDKMTNSEQGPSGEAASPPLITTLLKELRSKVGAEWEHIAIFLHIEDGILQAIKQDYPRSSRQCFIEMLKHWLKQVDPPPTWTAIIDAIHTLGHESLAHDLRQKYLCVEGDVGEAAGV